MLASDAIVTLTSESEESSEESSSEEFILVAVPDAPMYSPIRTDDARVRLSSDHSNDDYYVCFPKEEMNVGVFDRPLLQHKLPQNYTKKSKKPIEAKEELEENPNEEFFEARDFFSPIPRPAPVERMFKREGKWQKEKKSQGMLALDTMMTLTTESEESSEESSDEEFVLVAVPDAPMYSVRTDDARVGLSRDQQWR